jgi:hypothetical protein
VICNSVSILADASLAADAFMSHNCPRRVRRLVRRPDGITVALFERGEIGPDLFRAACRMGLEGLVSKHRDRPYRGGRQKFWVKVKNRSHPAMDREL